MPELNIFKIYPRQKDNLIQLLEAKGIISTASITQESENEDLILNLFFTHTPLETDVKWIKEINKAFNIPEKKRHNYSAAIIIDYGGNIYCLSYGSSHFYISRYCDYEFGIDFASRVLKTFKIKNSRSFGGATNKSILTYNNINEMVYDGGESVSYLKGEPIDTTLWGNNISCGQSIKLRKRDIDITKVHLIIPNIEEIINENEVIVDIPRSALINDTEKKSQLKNKLIRDIQQQNYIVTISEQQLSGVEFIFSDKYEYFLTVNGAEFELISNITLDQINGIIHENHIDFELLLNSEVKVKENDEYKYSRPFLDFVDYIDSHENYYLESGNWYQFDTNYIKFLKSAVDLIRLSGENEMPLFNETEYITWLEENDYNKKTWYREKYLNQILENDYNYKNYDRDYTRYEKYTIEFTDLYKDGAFFAVKIGKPQKLNYVIDQSLNALKVIQHTNYEILVDEELKKVSKFVLWLFMERETDINNLSEINSIIFLMKLANWRKEVLLAGYDAEIRISYFRRTS